MTSTGPPPSRTDLLEWLSESILDGRHLPGSKLPSERQLAEQHSLSRPLVREALRSLAERGLVSIVPGRGAYVRTAGVGDLAEPMGAIARQYGATPRNLVEARDMLERQAAALAADRATHDEIEAMQTSLQAFDSASNLIERAESDLAFHALIAKASHNPVVETMFGSIASLVFEMQLRSLDDSTVVAQGGPIHWEILQAIREHRPDAARAAMHIHVTLAYELFGPDLDASLHAIARRKVARIFGAATSLEEVIASVLERRAWTTPQNLSPSKR